MQGLHEMKSSRVQTWLVVQRDTKRHQLGIAEGVTQRQNVRQRVLSLCHGQLSDAVSEGRQCAEIGHEDFLALEASQKEY